jgi:hypothetical protein
MPAQRNGIHKASAILIMAKRQAGRAENKPLLGRIALAAALWHSAPDPKPLILYVASDSHGQPEIADAQVVRSVLTENLGIPPGSLMLREKSNCTLVEVRMVRNLARTHGFDRILAVTHPYHAPRVQRYFDEVLHGVRVVTATSECLTELTPPSGPHEFLEKLRPMIEISQPGRWQLVRERLVEGLLDRIHLLDPRGRLERWLARILRGVA